MPPIVTCFKTFRLVSCTRLLIVLCLSFLLVCIIRCGDSKLETNAEKRVPENGALLEKQVYHYNNALQYDSS
ncbi:MAG: hypothetical protein ACRCYO_06015, partial [Bacteroidia bacterium]